MSQNKQPDEQQNQPIDPWTYDLSAPPDAVGKPGRRGYRIRIKPGFEKPKKKDHKCPHDRRNPTGMEVCITCDFRHCVECGMDYNQRDMYGGSRCYPCHCLHRYEEEVAKGKREQEQRKIEYAQYLPGGGAGEKGKK